MLLVDECECGASSDWVLAYTSLSSAPKAWDRGDRLLASRARAEAVPIGRLMLRR
jgi:hypothetical protein